MFLRDVHRIGITIAFIIGLLGCKPEPVAINYHRDMCAYCKMSIADPRFGAEIVTSKGKPYMFDAIECMVLFQREFDEEIALLLVNTYDDPGKLVAVDYCVFLRSPKVPSPMGANLSAFADTEILSSMNLDSNDRKITWSELISMPNLHAVAPGQ